jgi:acetylornithine deacetylase/succinyl-diaminopimelate desuccinylase-like protein
MAAKTKKRPGKAARSGARRAAEERPASGAKEARVPAMESVRDLLGDEKILDLYERLVKLDLTNLEDPLHDRWEKRHYVEGAEIIASAARRFGFKARVWDAAKDAAKVVDAPRGLPRPSVIVDYECGAAERFIVMSHFDVVPVSEDQMKKWSYDPRGLTIHDGRIYGRGTNDDIGSGVVTSLQALREIAEKGFEKVNIRMIFACDEETGGSGGLEAMIRKDEARRAAKDAPEFLDGHLALLPDSGPEIVAGSSGICFGDVSVPEPAAPLEFLKLAQEMRRFRSVRESVVSKHASKDWPAAPNRNLTGRFTVTKLDFAAAEKDARKAKDGIFIKRVHAESESHNTVPEVVTAEIEVPAAHAEAFKHRVWQLSRDHPLRLASDPGAGGGTFRLEVFGVGGHGGYPHRWKNAVDLAIPVLEALAAGVRPVKGTGGLGFDLRLIPEETLPPVKAALERHFDAARRASVPSARLSVPPDRAKFGYSLPLDDPDLQFLVRAYQEAVGKETKIVGEYGGTDASSFSAHDVRTPLGKPMRALMFGSMDLDARIHNYDESADPRLIRDVINVMVWMAENWRSHK